MNKIYNVISIVKKKKLKNRYDVYSNDKNQNEKLFFLSLSLIMFVLETFEFPCFLSSRTISTFFTIQKTPNLCTHVVARVQNHSFRLYWTRPRSPIIRKRLERTLQNVIASFLLVSDFSVTFSHNRLVNTLFQQYSHKTKWTSNPKRRKTCTTATASSPDRSPESVTFVAEISFLRYSIHISSTSRDYILSNKLYSPYLKIPRFPNNIQTIHFWYISSDIEWSIFLY